MCWNPHDAFLNGSVFIIMYGIHIWDSLFFHPMPILWYICIYILWLRPNTFLALYNTPLVLYCTLYAWHYTLLSRYKNLHASIRFLGVVVRFKVWIIILSFLTELFLKLKIKERNIFTGFDLFFLIYKIFAKCCDIKLFNNLYFTFIYMCTCTLLTLSYKV